MAADNLPSEFDVVILGTGLTESVVAAACSRVGQRVLHVDRRNYYAGNWASFTFNGLLSWIEEYKAQQEATSPEAEPGWRDKLEEGEEALTLNTVDNFISNIEIFCYVSQEDDEEEEEKSEVAPPTSAQSDELEENGTKEITTTMDEALEQQGHEGPEDKETDEACQSPQEEEPPVDHNQSEPTVDVKKKISYAKLLKEGRRFNIDLVSKLMYSRGALVDLLIKSNVSRYAEFKNVNRILTYRNGKVEQVPCSRADVFSSKQLTMVEKRMLMKFLTFCLDFEQHPEEFQECSEQTFWAFLQTKKLTENLQHFIIHSIAMVSSETLTEDGLRATQHFLRCLGRYGNTPFLFPLYGLGEIPQCFCRMCAVFGGIYCLRHSVRCLVIDKEANKCKALIDSRGQRISCSHLVVEEGYVAKEQRKSIVYKQTSRAVLITDRSVLPQESDQQVSLVTIPPLEASGSSVRMVELCSSSMTCMPGTYLVHLTCSSTGTAREDLGPVVSRMFYEPATPGDEPAGDDRTRPTVLWGVYFSMRDTSQMDSSEYHLPSNVHVCTGPDASLGSDYSIKLAESIFQKLLPDEEFCPPAPNPEDIIYDGDGNPGEGAGFEESPKSMGSTIEDECSRSRPEGKTSEQETETKEADTTEE
ncbi:rab proteins geranylgeranyltransferase component A 1 [Denticeps clupeoides]|uniref:Rab proteins geranylgeranyltransferase component A n=1 Tax=Denticeps clupeoides TaxID=299321 RepID=A0AAY4A7L0_9TELE|nr:rab proteins geranylgeranyltransferase component A 2-like [Denticeps clupeoides]